MTNAIDFLHNSTGHTGLEIDHLTTLSIICLLGEKVYSLTCW